MICLFDNFNDPITFRHLQYQTYPGFCAFVDNSLKIIVNGKCKINTIVAFVINNDNGSQVLEREWKNQFHAGRLLVHYYYLFRKDKRKAEKFELFSLIFTGQIWRDNCALSKGLVTCVQYSDCIVSLVHWLLKWCIVKNGDLGPQYGLDFSLLLLYKSSIWFSCFNC